MLFALGLGWFMCLGYLLFVFCLICFDCLMFLGSQDEINLASCHKTLPEFGVHLLFQLFVTTCCHFCEKKHECGATYYLPVYSLLPLLHAIFATSVWLPTACSYDMITRFPRRLLLIKIL